MLTDKKKVWHTTSNAKLVSTNEIRTFNITLYNVRLRAIFGLIYQGLIFCALERKKKKQNQNPHKELNLIPYLKHACACMCVCVCVCACVCVCVCVHAYNGLPKQDFALYTFIIIIFIIILPSSCHPGLAPRTSRTVLCIPNLKRINRSLKQKS